ncbi:MAG TPA: class I SAM-dependent methyltransferase [Acidimicrobiales bacterium]
MDAFLAGEPQLLPFEVDELGPLEGRLLHLQSGSGLDSLDIARLHPTVCVTGLDDAPHEVEAATQLASEVRLAHRARFVYAGLFHAIDVLEHQHFDVVYTGKGALHRVLDLDRWAGIVHDLVEPGGFLYCTEFHPVTSPQQPPVGAVISAVLRAGLTLELFHEWIERPVGTWRPVDRGSVPVRYSLKAVRDIGR